MGRRKIPNFSKEIRKTYELSEEEHKKLEEIIDNDIENKY